MCVKVGESIRSEVSSNRRRSGREAVVIEGHEGSRDGAVGGGELVETPDSCKT